jgi:hypothetical protein
MFATKIIDLGREKEIVGYYPDCLVKEIDGLLGPNKDAYKKERPQFWKDKDNKDRAVRRAKTKIRRLAKRYNMQYMWTLTFAKEKTVLINPVTKKKYIYDCSTWDGAWKLFQRFIARCKKVGLVFDYIATAEIQEERQKKYGETVFHFHMATNLYIPQNKMMLKKYNHSHKNQLQYSLNDFWTFGHTKVTQKKSNKFCSNYMVKYISKTFDDISIKARQRYHVSQGMIIPVTKIEFLNHREMIEWCLKENIPVLDKNGIPVNKYFILGDSLEIWWWLLEG